MATTLKNISQVTEGVELGTVERVWLALPSADRFALLGHTDNELSGTDKVRLDGIMRALTHQRLHPQRRSGHRTHH